MFGNRAAAVVASVTTAIASTNVSAFQDGGTPSDGQRTQWAEALAGAQAGAGQDSPRDQTQPTTPSTPNRFRQGFDQVVNQNPPANQPPGQVTGQPVPAQPSNVTTPQNGRDLSQLTPAELAQYAQSLQQDLVRIRNEGIVAERTRQVYDAVRDARGPDAARAVLQTTHERYLERQRTLERIPTEGAVTLDPSVEAQISQIAARANQFGSDIDRRLVDFGNRLTNAGTSLTQQLTSLNSERGARLRNTSNISALTTAAASNGLVYNEAAHSYTVDPTKGPTFTNPAASQAVQSALAFRDPEAIRTALRAGTERVFTADMPREQLMANISRLQTEAGTYSQSLAFNQEALRQSQEAAGNNAGTTALINQLVPAIQSVTRTELALEAQNRLPIGAGQQSHGGAQTARLGEVQRILEDGRREFENGMRDNFQRLDTVQRRAGEAMNAERSTMGQRVVETDRNGLGLPTRIRLGEILKQGAQDVVRGDTTPSVKGRGEPEQDVADLLNAIRRQSGVTVPAQQR